LCSPQVGWRALTKMFSLLDSCVALLCMAFLLFLPLSNHHYSNVNVLFSNIYFPLKIFGILYTTTLFVSHVALPNMCVSKYNCFQWILMGKWHHSKKTKKPFVLCYVDKLFNL
jgi:hypothetical protein